MGLGVERKKIRMVLVGGMETRKRRMVLGVERKRRRMALVGGMEIAKRTTMQTKISPKKIGKIIMVESKEERGILMAWTSQHTISFGVLIFHWSKFCKNVWKTR